MASRKPESLKEFTNSSRKRTLKSSSRSSSFPSRNTSKSSEKSSFQKKNKEKKDLETFKTIYKSSEEKVEKDDDSNLTLSIIAWFQGTISVYVMSSIIFQLVWDGDWFILLEVLIFELFGVVQLLMLSRRPYTGTTCFFLSVQFVLLFLLFSLFLHSPYDSGSPFLQKVFGISAVSLMSAFLHFFIVVQSIQLVKESCQRNDYSEKVIVEGVEKRRKDLYLMISDLISEICYDDRDLKVNLKIRDETGHPKSMRGAGVEAGVSRVLEMSTDGQRVNLSTSNTSMACINVPKHHHKHHKKGHHSKSNNYSDLPPMIDAKYNNCEKQEKMLSPRKILN
ncbi:hypothetical protein CAEBREN_02269 [Caenorhabditis brenneri]|uniref:Uncharacterized protein n=1 Tax=Caenorhabditis brenneri TaxID=135651 RepID=G0MJF2_CAEBE|nr:hypothetical protein CAEBREN_02269 [Caenorhabditis brenneri]